jgi:hypothetical protein
MTPTIGRIVIYREGDAEGHTWGGQHPTSPGHPGTNGTREHPAIITRVWGDTCVNLHVFFDANMSEPRSSALLLPDFPEGVVDVSGNSGWRWPVSSHQKAS